MKCLRLLSVINGLFLSSNVAATALVIPMPDSYVDFSLNTPWESQAPDREPTDLFTPEQLQENSSDAVDGATEDTNTMQQFLQEIYLEKIPAILWQFIETPSMIGFNQMNKEQFTFNNTDASKLLTPKNQLDVFSL